MALCIEKFLRKIMKIMKRFYEGARCRVWQKIFSLGVGNSIDIVWKHPPKEKPTQTLIVNESPPLKTAPSRLPVVNPWEKILFLTSCISLRIGQQFAQT